MKTNAPTEEHAAPVPPPVITFVRYWLPVVLLCVFIFIFSHDSGSGQRSSRLIGPFIRWLVPGISETAVDRAVYSVRKAAHVAEFAALAMLVWRARRQPRRNDTRPWNWREAAFALGFAVLYAASDEIHQSFVKLRQGHVSDVFIDAGGAALGLLAVRAWGRWRGRW